MKNKIKQTEFISFAHCLVDEERDKKLSLASIDKLKQLVPDLFLTEGYADCLVIASNLAVVNKINLNGDAIDTATAIKFYKTLLYKGIDIEHQNKKIIGSVVNVGLSKFNPQYKEGLGSEILSEEEAAQMTEPFNIAYCGIIYRRVSEPLINVLLDCSNPQSANYLAVASSWMLNFEDYDIIYGSENVNECEVITDEKQKLVMKNYLKCYGGTGRYQGKPIGRLLKEPDFAGLGIVRSPASQVSGVLTIDNIYSETFTCSAKEQDLNAKTCDLHNKSYTVTCSCGHKFYVAQSMKDKNVSCEKCKATWKPDYNNLPLEIPSAPINTNMNSNASEDDKTRTFICISCQTEGFFSPMSDIAKCTKCNAQYKWDKETNKALHYNADNTVDGDKKNKEKSSQIEKTNVKEYSMKSIASIQELKTITQEDLKDYSIASFQQVVEKALSDSAVEAKTLLEKEKTTAEEAIKRATAAEASVAELSKKLQEIQTAQIAANEQATFNARMQHLDSEYNLDDAYRGIIVKQIKGLDESAFAAWSADFAVIAKDKRKTQTSQASATQTDAEKAAAEKAAAQAILDKAEAEKAAAVAAGIEGAKKTQDILEKAFNECVKIDVR